MEVPQESPKIVVVNANKKSLVASILLTLFFGPLGLLYSSVSGGIIMIIVTVLISIFTLGLGLLISFPICIIWGIIATNAHNAKINDTKFNLR